MDIITEEFSKRLKVEQSNGWLTSPDTYNREEPLTYETIGDLLTFSAELQARWLVENGTTVFQDFKRDRHRDYIDKDGDYHG